MSRTACITTPIYYVNDHPHIGHVFTTTLCDAWARAIRLQDGDVFFLTGTDEHGVKVEKSAAAHNMTPQAWADINAAEFQRALALFDLTNTDFIRTTQPRHEKQVQAFIERLQKSGALYKGAFEGWYDEGQEEYLTETRAKECDFKSSISGRPLVRAKEENWYFKLSAFSDRLKAHFEKQPGFVQPLARMNEVAGRLRDGLQDVPITRTNFKWGIPMPGDPGHVIYVWIDALFNYITALDYADDSAANTKRRYWPADWHVIGKEILWFHAVIWPAILMALELPLPKHIHAHSFWISEGQKMSKSLGNFIDLPTIEGYIAKYGLDAWRWFMLTRGPLDATDADFRAAAFHETYVADLVNTVGNCSSRVTAMIAKTFDGKMPADSEKGGPWPARCKQAVADWQRHFEHFHLSAAADDAMKLLREVDGFINQTEPFKLVKDPAQRDRVASILSQCLESVRIASLLLEPFLPQKMGEFSRLLGVPEDAKWDIRSQWGFLKPGAAVSKVALYPRVEAVIA
ncbi:MAG: methionine--tRNA ligase [Planctomycetes bacterium]|nr:methionine--tRNA ligase [Planctomycetota bacterium]